MPLQLESRWRLLSYRISRRMKSYPRAFENILFFSTKAAWISKIGWKNKMARADVASEVGLQNGKCCDKKVDSCLFRKISRTHIRLGLDLLDGYVLFNEDQEGERTTTPIHLLRPPSWNTRLRLRIALCLRLRWTCELPCACVCVARVNQPLSNISKTEPKILKQELILSEMHFQMKEYKSRRCHNLRNLTR